MKSESFDIAIIGAGASGSIASSYLSKYFNVVCLDQGAWTNPLDHPHYYQNWESKLLDAWNPSSNIRGNQYDYEKISTTSNILDWPGVGGGTNIYTALWPRLRPSDFYKFDEHQMAPNWPIDYGDLEYYYDETDKLVGVSGLKGNPAMPTQSDYPLPALPFTKTSKYISKTFDKLQWHWWPIPAGVISEDYNGRPACNHCGGCKAGCPRGSMSKFSLSVWPNALKNGTELILNATVKYLESKDGSVTKVVYVDRSTGIEHSLCANTYILAANGIGTPRILLNSNDLANSSGLVGKNLMHHTLVGCEMYAKENLESYKGFIGSLISMEFSETDPKRNFVNGFNFNCVNSTTAGNLSISYSINQKAPWGPDHHEWFYRHFGRGFSIFAIGDDLPQLSNCVTLSNQKDDFGVSLPEINYVPHDNDIKLMNFSIDRLIEFAEAADCLDYYIHDFGLNDVYKTPAWHLLGTCRMGFNPNDSVVDKFNKCWDLDNLYIIDGSIFPTGGTVNPTSTICALALRTSLHIKKLLRN